MISLLVEFVQIGDAKLTRLEVGKMDRKKEREKKPEDSFVKVVVIETQSQE